MSYSPLASFQKILTELDKLQEPGAFDKPPPFFPGLIAAGPEGSILTNAEIEREIRRIADWMLDQRPAAKNQHTQQEWRSAVRAAFGPSILQVETNEPLAGRARKLKKLIDTAINATPRTIDSLFTSMGCGLLDKPLAGPLTIGPVTFEPKADWLVRAERIGQLTSKTRERLTRAFAGKRLGVLKNKHQLSFERSIVNTLQDSQMVCTVETKQLAAETAQLRAIIGARLGQTALALLWRKPSGALEGFRLSVDHGPRQVRTIPYVPGRHLIGGWRYVGSPFGPHIKQKEWDKLITDARGLLNVAGRMIECWTSVPAYKQAPQILRDMAQAIYFYWEGCKDENDLMAIVKFTAVLEALAQGMSAEIVALAEARLGLKEGAKIVGDKDIKQVVEWIYGKARSRTLHGSNLDILHDWSGARAVAEELTRHCLVCCMDWLETNPGATQTKELLR